MAAAEPNELSDVEKVRLLLSDHHRCRQHWAWSDATDWASSYRALVGALADLARQRPQMARFLYRAWLERPARGGWFAFGLCGDDGYQKRELLLDFPTIVQSRIETALRWVAARMSQPIALPPWHCGDDELVGWDPFDDADGQDWYDEPDEEWRLRLDHEPDWPVVRPEPLRRLREERADVVEAATDARAPAEPQPQTSARRTRRRVTPVGASRVGELLEREVGDGVRLEELRALVRRGRPARCDDELRRRLAAAIARLRTQRRVRVAALALALRCDPATIWRQIQRAERAGQL